MRDERILRRLTARQVTALDRRVVDDATLDAARRIVDDVSRHGDLALRAYAERLDGLPRGEPLQVSRVELTQSLALVGAEARALLERTAARIRRFAEAQRAALLDVTLVIPGGRAGHEVRPLASAGCYAPGGAYPLPSSVLMTAVTARVAGVAAVYVCSPRPAPITLAAAAIAGVDAFYRVGGAQAIAALACGTETVRPVDVVVGPGNKWVTAAKQLVAHRVAIDMLAGPSELVVIADAAADPERCAADLLAQAEHAADALPILLTPSRALAEAVDAALGRRLVSLSTAGVARQALAGGFAVVTRDLEQAAALCERLAPEHVELLVSRPGSLRARLRSYGTVFVGSDAAEVLGDYGAGPNHVLPTGGSARFAGGLSVSTFVRLRTWLCIDDPAGADELVRDAAALARHEGLTAHALAADLRRASAPVARPRA